METDPLDDFVKHAPSYALDVREVELDGPFFEYFGGLRDEPFAFLLDSALASPKLGRYSFMGARPFLTLRARRSLATDSGPRAARIRLDSPNRHLELEGDPLAVLRALLEKLAVEREGNETIPFLGGAVGHFGYECGHFVERLSSSTTPWKGDDAIFAFYDTVFVHEHARGKTYLSTIGRGASPEEARNNAEAAQDEWRHRLRSAAEARPTDDLPAAHPIDANLLQALHADEGARYAALVERARQHILAGSAFEICLTRTVSRPSNADPWLLYRLLRRDNPAPFSSFLVYDELVLVGASPERFLRLDRWGNAESRPIKGTRARGRTAELDEMSVRELAASEKDRAENVMIVDLVRNDFGRVCQVGTVRVPELRIVETYATVHQLVSTVTGTLRQGLHATDLVRACFPGGSMTGAPKVEALKIIDELESDERGPYSGAVGYFDFGGSMDLAMVIRSFALHRGILSYGVGGAIVVDSDPHDEFLETITKAVALERALAGAGH
jgi:para-aminobenzoate synthetase component 1